MHRPDTKLSLLFWKNFQKVIEDVPGKKKCRSKYSISLGLWIGRDTRNCMGCMISDWFRNMLIFDELRGKATAEDIETNLLEQFQKIGFPYKPFLLFAQTTVGRIWRKCIGDDKRSWNWWSFNTFGWGIRGLRDKWESTLYQRSCSMARVYSASHATGCSRCPQIGKILQSIQQFNFQVKENRRTFAQISCICFEVIKENTFSHWCALELFVTYDRRDIRWNWCHWQRFGVNQKQRPLFKEGWDHILERP